MTILETIEDINIRYCEPLTNRNYNLVLYDYLQLCENRKEYIKYGIDYKDTILIINSFIYNNWLVMNYLYCELVYKDNKYIPCSLKGK